MCTAKLSAPSNTRIDRDERASDHNTSGGCIDTELKLLAVTPDRMPVGGARGDDSDAGGKLPQRVAKG